MDIRSVHAYLAAEIFSQLEITEPYPARIQRAWKFIPPQRQAISDVPCAFSTFEQKPVIFGPGILHKDYSIHVQMPVGKVTPDGDVAADMAAAFLEALIQSLSRHITLGGTVSVMQQIRGETPETLAVLEWAGQAYVGLDLWIDVRISEAAAHAA